jgi:hypothetical protein
VVLDSAVLVFMVLWMVGVSFVSQDYDSCGKLQLFFATIIKISQIYGNCLAQPCESKAENLEFASSHDAGARFWSFARF